MKKIPAGRPKRFVRVETPNYDEYDPVMDTNRTVTTKDLDL